MRTLEVCGASVDEIRNFEYSCLGEVRILGALQHSCIVELYGHQLSSKWIPSNNGNPERRMLQSVILMEHVKGGSLKVRFYSLWIFKGIFLFILFFSCRCKYDVMGHLTERLGEQR